MSEWLHTRLAVACLLAALGAISPTAHAQPTAPAAPLEVLADTGKSIPLAPYLSYLVAGEAQEGVMQGLRFPIMSQLRAGLLGPEEVQVFEPTWLVQPIFIVGADVRSLLWLEHNRQRLSDMHAWGVVVEASTVQAFKAIQRAVPGVSLAPSVGTWLEQRLQAAGAGVYPVLIDTQGRARQIVLDTTQLSQAHP